MWLAFGAGQRKTGFSAIHRRYYKAFVDHVADALRVLAPGHSAREVNTSADAVVAALDGVGTRATLEPEDWPPKRQRQTLAALLTPLLAALVKA